MPFSRLLGLRSAKEIFNWFRTARDGKCPDAPPVPESSLVLCDVQSVTRTQKEFPSRVIVACRDCRDCCEALHALASKQSDIVFVSASLVEQMIGQPGAVQTLAQSCSGRVWLPGIRSEADANRARQELHRAGFYEVAAFNTLAHPARFDRSSIPIYPDGRFQMLASAPGVQEGVPDEWWVASRLPLQETECLPWTWIYGMGKVDRDGFFAAGNANEQVLAVRHSDSRDELQDALRIQATVSCLLPPPQRNSMACVGSLVGCYHGPGDSHMYLAMVELPAQHTAQFSLWKNVGDWEQLQTQSFPLSSILNGAGMTTSDNSFQLVLEITREELRLIVGSKCLLQIVDQSLPRKTCFGARILGTQIRFGHIELSQR